MIIQAIIKAIITPFIMNVAMPVWFILFISELIKEHEYVE